MSDQTLDAVIRWLRAYPYPDTPAKLADLLESGDWDRPAPDDLDEFIQPERQRPTPEELKEQRERLEQLHAEMGLDLPDDQTLGASMREDDLEEFVQPELEDPWSHLPSMVDAEIERQIEALIADGALAGRPIRVGDAKVRIGDGEFLLRLPALGITAEGDTFVAALNQIVELVAEYIRARHNERMQDPEYAAAYEERRRIEELRKTDAEAAEDLEREIEIPQRTFLTPAEAGTRLGVTGGDVMELVASGKLKAIRIPGNAIRIPLPALVSYLRRREEGEDRKAREPERPSGA